MQNPYVPYLCFRTEFFLDDAFDGQRNVKMMSVFPSNNQSWNFTLLSCFLNEHGNFRKAERRAYQETTKDGTLQQKFTFQHILHTHMKIYVTIASTAISLKMSTSYIKQAFTRKHIVFQSNLGKGGKICIQSRIQDHVFYDITFSDPKDGTKALFLHSPLIFNASDDFSDIFAYFCKKLKCSSYPKDCDTASIDEYIELWIIDEKNRVNSLDTLTKKIRGYLHLDLQKCTVAKRLPQISYTENGETSNYYIVSGVYISPWSKSILANTEVIHGYLLDTTWKIMQNFVTSILMASSLNVGIPLGFAFGKSEDKVLYTKLLTTMKDKLDLEFKGKVIESDQGSALKAVAKEFEMIHLACLRHLLVSLKYNEHTYLLSMLIKATTQEEYDAAFAFITQKYETIDWNNKKLVRLLKSLLKKVGLMYDSKTKRLSILDKERWEGVALLYRVPLHMPSTTNALESTHGHMNQKTPRRNNFFTSLHRIVECIMKKSQNIQECIQNNYAYAKHAPFARICNFALALGQ